MKTVFFGSVKLSKIALETLLECGVSVDKVFSVAEQSSSKISDYYPLHEVAVKHGIPFTTFSKINDEAVMSELRALAPDFIFVIGLSQLVKKEFLDLANKYVIGFHPTLLPRFRGRAALPWQILLGVRESGVTLLKLDEGTDSGDILQQVALTVAPDDYASDLYEKACLAVKAALKECVKGMYDGTLQPLPQDHEKATYLLVRRPEDGHIDWSRSSQEIYDLIRATSRPYPGAFTKVKGEKMVIWRAKPLPEAKYIGVPGQIGHVDSDGFTVVTGDGNLLVSEFEIHDTSIPLRQGAKLGN